MPITLDLDNAEARNGELTSELAKASERVQLQVPHSEIVPAPPRDRVFLRTNNSAA